MGKCEQRNKKQNTTQEWVSKNSDISYMTFKGWIAKDVLPRAEDAVKIAKALGVTVEYLVTGRDDSQSFEDYQLLDLAKKYQKALSDLEDMDELQRSTVLIQIEAVADSCRETSKKKNG